MRQIANREEGARLALLALVAAFAAFVACAGVFTLPPLDRDEARFAQATAQMLESGDFVSIRFQEEERNKKPAGIHWLQAAAVASFSDVSAREIWAYRLPSVAGAILAALFTCVAGTQLFGSRVGLLAALLLASAPGVAAEATIAKTDAMLLACVAAAQASLIHIVGAVIENRRAGAAWPFLFWISIGAGVLIKGPIILMVCGLTVAALLLQKPRLILIKALRPVSGFVILAVMIAPWALAINAATEGRFFAEAIGGDMLAKIGGAQEHHAGPPGYYAALAFVLFWPSAALIVAGAQSAVAMRNDWKFRFLLGWIVPSWIVFELTATKLPHYALPLYPAVALLAAHAAFQAADGPVRWAQKAGAVVYGITGAAIAGLIAVAPRLYGNEPNDAASIGVAGLIAAASVLIASFFWRGRPVKAARASAVLSAGVAWTLLAGVLPGLDRLALSPRISAALGEADLHPLRDGAAPVVLSGFYEPSAVFLLGTKTMMAEGRDAAEKFVQSKAAAVVEGREDAAFLSRLQEVGASAERFAVIEGFNYSNGDHVILRLYRFAPQSRP
jgi:4-amino-4-deoxy-L-arabinose transferase-like glycosyltransferase